MNLQKIIPVFLFSVLFVAGCCQDKVKPVAKAAVAEPVAMVDGDQDQDGVLDSKDACPNTPLTAKVDARGCWVLEGVHFDNNKATLKPESDAILDRAVSVLKKNPGANIVIEGHTDSRGAVEYNNALSQRRADAVKAYFVDHGVNGAQLTTKGYGPSKPVATNDTREGRAANRRVELSAQ